MVAIRDLKTGLGSRFCMTVFEKTLEPKTCPGSSSKVNTFSGGSYPLTASMACNLAVLPLMKCLLLGCSEGGAGRRWPLRLPSALETLRTPHNGGVSEE